MFVRCIVQKVPEEKGAGLVTEALPVNIAHPVLRDHKDLRVHLEIRDLQDQKAVKVLRDARVISAPSIVSSLVSMVVNETDAASFQCHVRGNPIPQITWMKENFSLPVTKRIQLSRRTMVITTVTSQDGGMYTCQAKNILGVVRSSATLTVQGKNNEVLFQCLCYERILSTKR